MEGQSICHDGTLNTQYLPVTLLISFVSILSTIQ